MVLGELGFRDRAADRRRYGQRLEERAKEDVDAEQLRPLREGWLLGREAFRDRVLDLMESRGMNAARKIRREQTDEDHDQRHAERLIIESLAALGIGEEELLTGSRKGDWRKRVIAHRVRSRTSVSLRWLAERLRMGSEGHVSRLARTTADLATRPEWKTYESALRRNERKKD